ncbi:YceI family protein [Myroides odoratimimus]|uniref:YceI family protein n=1 Tax=Myroides odoratimimus TaxID=76832 RepID=UPI00103C1545|nr:YceI family protein [Myroides odoratimimus]MCA4792903.1 YceI family protein [Myroides odoratimimus]MCA4820226.1 YceI family protein [Myroides odoratimimus]MDM1059880.1 YceI family protein [Myroides odoratimimus]MDM1065370.1 YceI family protein [Myroides odoratimimus]MDM1094594.1 YceI family protein [Myroides odoratimimus]
MKKIVLSLAVIATLTLASCGNKNADKATTTTEQEVAVEQGDKYSVNLTESNVTWKVGHKGGVNPRYGTLTLKAGDIAIDANGLNAGSYTIDMNSIKVDRASVSADEDIAKLEGHLKSADFFNVEANSTVDFKITNVEDFDAAKHTSKIEGANKVVSGNLTILGKTVNITFPAKVTVENGKAVMDAAFVADRTEWGLVFGTTDKDSGAALNPADWAISQDMEIGIHLVADKVAE